MNSTSRRNFLASGVAAALTDPACSAAQAVGVKRADLPDLTIKEVKVYVLEQGRGNSRVASIVTSSGIEGNYTLADRYWHPNWSNLGWLDYAKQALAGKNVLDLPAITSQ